MQNYKNQSMFIGFPLNGLPLQNAIGKEGHKCAE